jgi:hypothetical protein
VQAYPESLLAKLADNEDDGVMEEKTDAIRLDRDPAVFAHVLKLLDKPLEAVETEALREELDFYGLLPSSTMLPASMVADMCSRDAENAVSSIVDQMGVLMNEKLADNKRNVAVGHQLTFLLTNPTNAWSEVQVRNAPNTWTPKDVKWINPLPPHIQQPLETRLRSLGYTVKIDLSSNINFPRITVSWAPVTATRPSARSVSPLSTPSA